MAYSAAAIEHMMRDEGHSMFILNQKKNLLVKVTDVKVQNTKVIGVSQQHQMGMTLGKYHSGERAQAVLLSLVAELKASPKLTVTFEMPRE